MSHTTVANQVNLFDYTDFRAYLQKYYDEKKAGNPHYSYQLLAQKAELNRSFIFNIFKGSKKLAKAHCFKLSRALNHSKNESAYFENIVAFAQAANEEERQYYLEQALHNKSGNLTPSYLLRKDQFEFYSKWYHCAVRSLIGMFAFKDNFPAMGRKLRPPVASGLLKQSVQLLVRLGIIRQDESGVYHITEKKIRAGDDISLTARNRFHIECTELAKGAITSEGPERRNVSSLTLGISERTYEAICRETQEFKNRITELANSDPHADRVYQYQLLFFPLTTDEKL